MLEETSITPAFFPRFLRLANGYFVSTRNFALGQQVFRYTAEGTLTGEDTLALGEAYFSYEVNGAPHLVSQSSVYSQGRWTMRSLLYRFDTEGFFADSIVLRVNELNQGESPSGFAFHYNGSVLTFLAGSVSPSPPIIDFRVWLSTYDGNTATHTPPWDPGPLEPLSYITSWGILRTADARFVLSAFIRSEEFMQFWFMGLESDGSFNSNLHIQDVADNHLLNGLVMHEIQGSLVYAFTEVTTDGSYGGGAQIAAFPLDELLDAEGDRPEIPDELSVRAFPNPFNASSTIEFALPAAENVTLTIFDVIGREVTGLLDTRLTAGRHSVHWNSHNSASGKYFIKLTAGSRAQIYPIILAK